MTPLTRRLSSYGLLLLLLACGTGCYECRWAAAGKVPTPALSVEGRWQGVWEGDSGHSGGLRCIISEVTPNSFKADFKASYAWIFTFSYQATMRITAGDCATQPSYIYFNGKENIGWLAGGEYEYDGKVGPTEFFCRYKSSYENGTFQMVRPGGAVKTQASP